MEVVGDCRAFEWFDRRFFPFYHRELSCVFQRKKTVNRDEKQRRFWTGAAVFQARPLSFNIS